MDTIKKKIKKILIVDDEDDLTWSLSRKLSRDESCFDVYCANSGKSAIDLLDKTGIDLLVTDLRMPGINGLELLNVIKANHPNVRVIVMTAFGSMEIKQAIKRLGEVAYIEKPFEIKELRKMILDLLN